MTNELQLIGNLTADVDYKELTTGTKLSKFKVAFDNGKDKDGKDVTDYMEVQAWGTKAEACKNCIEKGSKVFVKGNLKFEKYEYSSKVDEKIIYKGTKIVLNADDVTFLSMKKAKEEQSEMG